MNKITIQGCRGKVILANITKCPAKILQIPQGLSEVLQEAKGDLADSTLVVTKGKSTTWTLDGDEISLRGASRLIGRDAVNAIKGVLLQLK